MKNNIKISIIALASIFLLSSTAQAETTVKAKTEASTMVTKAIAKSDKEIDVRISSLNKLIARIGEMKRLTDTQKSSITSKIQVLITDLTSLKAKIDAQTVDTATTTVKSNLDSITQSYRIFALVEPQIRLLAAYDRTMTLIDSLTTIGTKIQTRLNQAETAGKNVVELKKTFADYNAKVADANVQAKAIIDLITPLMPDNGDKTVATSNKTALTGARTALKKASEDIRDARKDAHSITKALGTTKIDEKVNASSTDAR